LSGSHGTTAQRRAYPFDLVFASALLALVFIDAEHMILPNVITYPGIVFASSLASPFLYLTGTPHFDDLPSLSARSALA
jgi:prepilin signal peptidase PulO-like enzyme (type II secretory pathway)